jgi:hypothetical protein
VRDSLDSWLRYARAHHGGGMLAALLALIACDIVFGSLRLDFPFTDGQGSGGVPLRHDIPLALSVIAVGGLDSSMNSLEETGSGWFRRFEMNYLAATVAISAGFLVVAELFVSPMDTVLLVLRAMVIWTGMALLSGRIFGWRLTWVLPLFSLLPLTYWQKDAQGHSRWWDWTDQSGATWPCWGIAAGSLLVGGLALALTPWRVARLRSGFVR